MTSINDLITPNTGLPGSASGAAQVAADRLLADAQTQLGPDLAALRHGLAGLAANHPGLAAEAREFVLAGLTPVQAGQLLAQQAAPATAAPAAPGPKPSTATDLAVPKTPALAPTDVRFSAANQAVFDAQWAANFPGGKSKEKGATITFDRKTGAVGTANVGGLGSTAGTFSPDLTVKNPKATGVLGIFHTHPYDASEGGHTGVSLSGGDAAYLINSKQNLIVAQSGDKQFMYLKTGKTPASVDFAALNQAQNDRIGALMAKGADFDAASRQAASETATKYGLAYYEGSNGSFQRINPR